MALRGALRGALRAALRAALACLAAALAGQASAACGADAAAAFQQALSLDTGRGAAPDQAAAFRCYREAAAAGLPAAEFNAAAMLEAGRGVARDPAAAALWYARAAAHGDARAAFDLGQLYESGDGVPRSAALARAWFRQAATGVPEAQRRLRDAPGAPPGTALAPPILENPSGPRDARELVWRLPPGAAPAHYMVSVVRLDAGAPQEIARAFTDVSATLAFLPPGQGRFAWRVLAVWPTRGHYAASAWAPL